MFYSQLLLSKKGPLGVVWMAAHCHKKLKKEQVQQTDISSSVDKILDDEVNVVTHRILAFLLLGIVRIYSKKVEYLFHDCHEMMNKLHGFEKGESITAISGVTQRHYRSISLPKRFELDAFDLELSADQDLVSGNGRSRKQLILAGGPQKHENALALLGEDNMRFSEAHSTDYTPLRDVLSPVRTDHDLLVIPWNNMNMSSAGKEIICGTNFLEDRLDPMDLDESEEYNIRSHSIPSLEILRGAQFSLEDRLDPMVLDESEKELNDGPSNDITTTNLWGPIQDVEFGSVANPSPIESDSVPSLGILHKSGFSLEHSPNLKMLNTPEMGQGPDEYEVEEEHLLNRQEDEPLNLKKSVDKTQSVGMKKMKLLTVIAPERICQELEAFPLSVVTPDLKLPVGVGNPEDTTLQTPATKEQRRRILKKQKILFDSTTKIPAREFRSWTEDPSDLKREKRKVSHPLLNAWRARKLSYLPQGFFEPLISGISESLGSLEYETIPAAPIKLVELPNGQDDVRHPADQQISDTKSPVKEQSPEQIAIAPSTPISGINSLTSVADSDMGPTNSPEIVEKSLLSCEGLELDAVFREETNSFDGDSRENDGYSIRTRMTENYLGSKFLEKKSRREEEVLNLSNLLAGKTKKESTRLFYDILVLKTRDSIDVQQENAYDNILLRKTSKLKQVSEN